MNILPSSTIICRTGFCLDCARANRPLYGQLFLVLGSHGYHVYEVEYTHRFKGFVPMFYKLIKPIGQNIIYERLCCMGKCAITLVWNTTTKKMDFGFDNTKWKRGIMTLESWNALVQYRRDNDYFV